MGAALFQEVGDSVVSRLQGLVWLTALTPAGRAQSARPPSEPTPMTQLGAKAGAHYQGDGLSVAPTPGRNNPPT